MFSRYPKENEVMFEIIGFCHFHVTARLVMQAIFCVEKNRTDSPNSQVILVPGYTFACEGDPAELAAEMWQVYCMRAERDFMSLWTAVLMVIYLSMQVALRHCADIEHQLLGAPACLKVRVPEQTSQAAHCAAPQSDLQNALEGAKLLVLKLKHASLLMYMIHLLIVFIHLG